MVYADHGDSGTATNAELYDLLLPDSVNQGEVDYDDLLALAVAGRNVHAAMLDAARLCRAI